MYLELAPFSGSRHRVLPGCAAISALHPPGLPGSDPALLEGLSSYCDAKEWWVPTAAKPIIYHAWKTDGSQGVADVCGEIVAASYVVPRTWLRG